MMGILAICWVKNLATRFFFEKYKKIVGVRLYSICEPCTLGWAQWVVLARVWGQ